MPGMDGFINFNGTLEGSIAGGGGGDVTDVKVRNSQETTFESVVNEAGVAEIDLISYVRRNELTQAIENVENSIDNVEQLVDTKQNIINNSTDDQVVGTWFGKPLYRRSYQFTTSNLPTDRYAFDRILYLDQLVKIEGGYNWLNFQDDSHIDIRCFVLGENPPQANDRAIWLLVEQTDSSDLTASSFDVNFNFNGKDRSKILKICASIEYTKTTD